MITPTADENAEKLDHSYSVDANVKWYNHPRKESGSLFKTNKKRLNIGLPYDPIIVLLSIHAK